MQICLEEECWYARPFYSHYSHIFLMPYWCTQHSQNEHSWRSHAQGVEAHWTLPPWKCRWHGIPVYETCRRKQTAHRAQRSFLHSYVRKYSPDTGTQEQQRVEPRTTLAPGVEKRKYTGARILSLPFPIFRACRTALADITRITTSKSFRIV